MKCPVCSAELPATARFCGGCGTTLTAPPPPQFTQPPPVFQPEPSYESPRPAMNPSPSYGGSAPAVQKKYKVLRLIAILIKVFAFVGAAIFIVAGLAMLVAGAASSSRPASSFGDAGPAAFFGGVVGGLIMLVYGVFVFVFLYAYSEWMYVFMDIEENTRLTNEMLSARK